LHAGGAETFVVRLANALAGAHEVVLFNIYPHLSKQALMNQLVPGVRLINLNIAGLRLKQKADGLLLRLGIDHALVEQSIIGALDETIGSFKPDVVHSHLFKPDYYVTKLHGKYKFCHVATNHGDYQLFEQAPPTRILNYTAKRNLVLQRLNHMANISDMQMNWFQQLKAELGLTLGIHKILNGYEVNEIKPLDRAALGIPEDAFVLGMVARGIPEKGWEYLVKEFVNSNLNNSYLILVGEGPAIDALRSQHSGDQRIIFAGYSDQPVQYIRLFDVGVLCSVYKGESLPTVVIEYLYCGKPVIATNVGEISKMLAAGNGQMAGDLLQCPGYQLNPGDLAALMKQYHAQPQYLAEKQQYTIPAFNKFDMKHCIEQYLSIYQLPYE
jgi:glycosyltransferase involved in cell wall biosynthesis